MSPPSEIFDAAELPDRVRFNEKGKFRKTTLDDGSGARGIDLRRCALLQMLQYHCTVDEPRTRDSPTRCYPVPRLFRRCQDKQGSFLVETTAWEGILAASSPSAAKAEQERHSKVQTDQLAKDQGADSTGSSSSNSLARETRR